MKKSNLPTHANFKAIVHEHDSGKFSNTEPNDKVVEFYGNGPYTDEADRYIDDVVRHMEKQGYVPIDYDDNSDSSNLCAHTLFRELKLIEND